MFLSNLTDQGVFFSTVELRYNAPSGNEVLGKRMIIILRHSNSKIIIWKRPSIYQGLVLANILFLPVPRPFTKSRFHCSYHQSIFSLSFLQFSVPDNIVSSDSLSFQDLPTIDVENLSSLSVEVVEVMPQMDAVTPQVDIITPQSPRAVPVTPNNAVETVCSEVPVGEEVIWTCVTPRKVHSVQIALGQKEVDRHILFYFY